MKTNIIYLFAILLIISCSESSNDINDSAQPPSNNNGTNSNTDTSIWSIPIDEVRDGGPGKDGIPSIDNPKFIEAHEADFLANDHLVVGVVKSGTIRAYPHKILNWHEIVNDAIDGQSVNINYCPLTGTAFGWISKTDGVNTTFGVSGLLYNANLILYDRNTDSNWSQLKLESVNGNLIGDKPTLFSVVETTWGTWKTLYPDTKVLSANTGINRNYEIYPYGDYKVNHERFIFRPSIINTSIPNKERVHAIIDGDKSKVYQFSNFSGGKAIKDVFNGKNYLIVGNESLIFSFELTQQQTNINFHYDYNSSKNVLFKDSEGNRWSVFGKAVQGPKLNESIVNSKSVMSYWFAIAAFYPNPEIYSNL